MNNITLIATRVRMAVAHTCGIQIDQVNPDLTVAAHGAESIFALLAVEDELGVQVSANDGKKLEMLPVKEWVLFFEALCGARACV
jgi:hypothetical protein